MWLSDVRRYRAGPEYLLKSYLYYQEIGREYTQPARNALFLVYKSKYNGNLKRFDIWLRRELEKIDMEDESDFR